MTQRNWLGNTGAWADPTQWAGGTLPGTADLGNFTASGTYSVNFATTASLLAITAGGGSTVTLDIASGRMTLSGNGANSNWNGSISQTGGTVVVQSGTFRLSGALTQTAGVFTLGLGAHLQQPGGTATFGGTLAGMGELDVGGTVTLSGIVHIGAIAMGTTGVIQVGSNETYAGAYIPNAGSLVLNGHSMTFTGDDKFGPSRVVGPGTVVVRGSADVAGTAMSGNGGTILDFGTVTMDGPFVLGTSATDKVALLVQHGGVFDILTDAAINVSNAGTVASGVIVNNGLFEKTAGVSASGVFSNVQAPLNNKGTLRVTAGTLLLTGGGSVLGGTVDGSGTLSIGAAGGVTLAAGVVVAPTLTITIGFGATLALAAGSLAPGADLFDVGLNSVVALRGHTLTVQGQGAFDSTLHGSGLLRIGGNYALNGLTVAGGLTTLEVFGAVEQSGRLRLGSGTADVVRLKIDAGGVYDLAGNGPMTIDSQGSARVVNSGLFEVTASGGAPDNVVAGFTNTATGRVLAATGAVTFSRGMVNNGAGTIDGIATINGNLTGTGSLTLEAGAILVLNGTVSAGQTITFAPGATGAELVIGKVGSFHGTVNQFAAGETLEFLHAVFNEIINSGATWGLAERLVGVNSVGAVHVQNPPGTFFLTEDGMGGRKILGSSPGTAFPGQSILPDPAKATNSWVPNDDLPRSWFTAADWSTLGIPDEHQAAVVGEPVPFDLEFAGGGAGVSGIVDNLMAGGNTTLQLQSGDLEVLEGGDRGGTFSGNVEQTGGKFDSVSGYKFNGKTYAQSAGFLESDSGALIFAGETVTLAGTVYGGGILQISGGTLVPVPGVAMQVNEILVTSGGSLVPFANETFSDNVVLAGGVMPLFASSVTFGGMNSALQANVNITTNGTIVVTGTADDSGLIVNGTSGELLVQGEVKQTSGDINLNSTSDLLSIAAAGTYDIQADVSPFGGHIVNAGLFEKTGGAGQSQVEEPFTSTGTAKADSGTLYLDSPSVELGGTVTGAGTLRGFGNDVMTLDAGLFMNVATFTPANVTLGGNQNYGGAFSDLGNLMLQGHTFTLSGSAELLGSITGSGVVNLTHSADLGGSFGLTIQGNGVTVNADGVVPVTQSSNIALGGGTADHVTLAIPAGHTYELLTDDQIGGVFGNTVVGTVANAGLLEKVGGVSGSGPGNRIYAELVNTGTVLVQHGTLTLNTAAINDGSIVVDGSFVINSSADLSADSGKSGLIQLTPTATLLANHTFGAGQTILFAGGGLLAISQFANFTGTIASFAVGDTIDLLNVVANSVKYTNGVLKLLNGVTQVATLTMPDLGSAAKIRLASDGNSGTFIVDPPACFAEGTEIATARGPVAVERIRVGDVVPVPRSERLRRVVWVAHRRVECRRHGQPQEVQPVRVNAGAFGDGMPLRTLRLSPDHAVYVHDVLVPVRHLINGVTVTQEDVDAVVYWHLELDCHEVLLAEGLPAESYLDTGNRHAFDEANPHTTGVAVAG